jgi:hypothetical protein
VVRAIRHFGVRRECECKRSVAGSGSYCRVPESETGECLDERHRGPHYRL